MTKSDDGKCTAQQTNPERFEEKDKNELLDRIFSSLLGLPRVCVFRVCRRKKRCLGPGLICFEHHDGLAKHRYQSKHWRRGLPKGPNKSR